MKCGYSIIHLNSNNILYYGLLIYIILIKFVGPLNICVLISSDHELIPRYLLHKRSKFRVGLFTYYYATRGTYMFKTKNNILHNSELLNLLHLHYFIKYLYYGF